MSNHRDATWHGTPGPTKGPRWTIEELLDRAYPDLAHIDQKNRRRVRSIKNEFVTYSRRRGFPISRPTLNLYLIYGVIPWPLPDEDRLVFVVDGDTHRLRWVSQSLCDLLEQPADALLEQPVFDALFPDQNVMTTQPNFVADLLRVQQRARLRDQGDLPALADGKVDQVHIDSRIHGQQVELHASYGAMYATWFCIGERIAETRADGHEELFNVVPDIKYVIRDADDVDVQVVEDIKDLLRLSAREQIEWYASKLPRYRLPSDATN
jgi:hypothetical protein